MKTKQQRRDEFLTTPPPKFMRPRIYGLRIGVNWRSIYKYIDQGVLPAYKFQGVVLLDVEECDAIIKGLMHYVAPSIKRPGKVGRLKKQLDRNGAY